MFKRVLLTLTLLNIIFLTLCEDKKLTGKSISSDSTSSLAFDGDSSTEYKSSSASGGWVGIELESPAKITKIGWSQKSSSSSYLLGVFEGSNDPSFIDGVPLLVLKEESKSGEINYAEISCDKTFKYIRYVGPNGKYSVISEIEVYGDSSASDNDDGSFYQPTNLPLVVVHTENSEEPGDKNEDINCQVLVINEGKKDTEEKGTIKLRGNATTRLEKRPYKFKLENSARLAGMPAKSKKWNLLANHSDKTLIRNNLAFKISELIGMPYTVHCEPVDLIFNGEYRGNYGLCDKIDIDKGRVEITKLSENDNQEPELTGGYLLQADAWSRQQRNQEGSTTSYQTNKGIVYVFEDPSDDDLTSAQKNYIQKYLNDIEADAYNGIYDKIDIDSFSKFILVGELVGNSETFWSTYMFKERSQDKLMFGPVWDFDISFDNDNRVYPTLEKTNLIFKYGSSAGTMSTFAVELLSIEKVLESFKNVWKEKTSSSLTKEALVKYIDEMKEKINESANLNFIRWPVLNKKVLLNPTTRGSFEAEMEYLRDYIQKRFDVVTSVVNSATTTSVQEKVSKGGFGGGGWGR